MQLTSCLLFCTPLVGLFLESDADEQLLVNIPLNQKCKVSSIAIKGPADGTGPRRIKLFTNLTTCGFSDAESLTPAQEIELTPAQLNGEPIPWVNGGGATHARTAQRGAHHMGEQGREDHGGRLKEAPDPWGRAVLSIRVPCYGTCHETWDRRTMVSGIGTVLHPSRRLKFVKFQNVTVLSIFIESNQVGAVRR